jgi:transposase InsO family protein
MDLYSRRIVGWDLDEHMTEALVLVALREAIRWRQPRPGLIHHSGRGGQYAGGEYRQVLQRARMQQSMSRPGNCYDNAFMESCLGTLKTDPTKTSTRCTRCRHRYNRHRSCVPVGLARTGPFLRSIPHAWRIYTMSDFRTPAPPRA